MSAQKSKEPFELQYIKTIGIVNNISGRGFNNPYDVAISQDRRIFVANRCGSEERTRAIRIGVCTFDEKYLHEFGQYGAGDGQMILPTALAFDSHDRLYLSDEYLHRISVFNSNGKYLHQWGEYGNGAGFLDGPSGVAFDSKDNVYVVDQNNHRVQKFTVNGEYQLQWGKEGNRDGEFNLPWGIALDNQDNVYVADWRNDRVQKFTSNGLFLKTFGEPGHDEGQFSRPSGVSIDNEGFVYVADWGNERVQVMDPDGRYSLVLQGQATESKWAMEYLSSRPEEYELRKDAEKFPAPAPRFTSAYHVSSQIESFFWGPVSVTLDDANTLYVTEANRHRLQIYQKV